MRYVLKRKFFLNFLFRITFFLSIFFVLNLFLMISKLLEGQKRSLIPINLVKTWITILWTNFVLVLLYLLTDRGNNWRYYQHLLKEFWHEITLSQYVHLLYKLWYYVFCLGTIETHFKSNKIMIIVDIEMGKSNLGGIFLSLRSRNITRKMKYTLNS